MTRTALPTSYRMLIPVLVLLFAAATGLAQTSTFTYQGRFTDGGTAANGTYDMQFKLFDGGGNQVGSTTTNGAVAVTGGVFTVQLDYSLAAFPGADRYLEISVRPAGSGEPYTVLAPRQQLTSTPYAIRSATADTATNAAQLNGAAADQYVLTNDSRLTDSRTPAAGSSNYIQNTNSLQAAANFNISGNGAAAGTISANTLVAATQFNIGATRVLSTKGNNNTFVGPNAGVTNTTGLRNSFLGAVSGFANTTGTENSFFGYGSGSANTEGSTNSFFGAFSGASNTTASENSFFGYSSGVQNSTGTGNSYFGNNSGASNTINSGNSFFGNRAGYANTAADNSFFGSMAGQGNTTGTKNSYFGKEAGSANQTGSSNTFFGTLAGTVNVASENSFFGAGSGEANTTGTRNSYFGTLTGVINETTSDSSFFGYEAGIASRGASNSFFGSLSGEKNITGFANAFFGFETGNANSTGFNNAFYGRGAGKANVTGNSNTLVGAFADVDSAGLTFATAIGAGAHVGTSNTIVLGRNNAADTVRVPGTLAVDTLGLGGLTSLCRNVVNQIANCSSSLRYKTNVQPFTGGLAVVNRLRPISFDWKQGGLHDLGFGAEEVAAVEPLLVTRNAQGQVEGVKYDRISVALVNAVKEQQEQIRQQQLQIESLKKLVCRQARKAGICKPTRHAN